MNNARWVTGIIAFLLVSSVQADLLAQTRSHLKAIKVRTERLRFQAAMKVESYDGEPKFPDLSKAKDTEWIGTSTYGVNRWASKDTDRYFGNEHRIEVDSKNQRIIREQRFTETELPPFWQVAQVDRRYESNWSYGGQYDPISVSAQLYEPGKSTWLADWAASPEVKAVSIPGGTIKLYSKERSVLVDPSRDYLAVKQAIRDIDPTTHQPIEFDVCFVKTSQQMGDVWLPTQYLVRDPDIGQIRNGPRRVSLHDVSSEVPESMFSNIIQPGDRHSTSVREYEFQSDGSWKPLATFAQLDREKEDSASMSLLREFILWIGAILAIPCGWYLIRQRRLGAKGEIVE